MNKRQLTESDFGYDNMATMTSFHKKAQGAVVSNWTGMNLCRNVLRVNTHLLTFFYLTSQL